MVGKTNKTPFKWRLTKKPSIKFSCKGFHLRNFILLEKNFSYFEDDFIFLVKSLILVEENLIFLKVNRILFEENLIVLEDNLILFEKISFSWRKF